MSGIEKKCSTCKFFNNWYCYKEKLPFQENKKVYAMSEDGYLKDILENLNEDLGLVLSEESLAEIEQKISELYQENCGKVYPVETELDFCCKYWE